MRTLFDDFTVVANHYQVGVTDGAETVGDDEAGAYFHQCEQGLLDTRLGAGIDAAGSLIQNENGWIGQDGT